MERAKLISQGVNILAPGRFIGRDDHKSVNMKLLQYIIGLCAALISGCTREECHSPQYHFEPQIIGGEYPAFGNTGRTAASTAFIEGDKVLFFSEGGMTAENVVLTFDGYSWQPDRTLEWERDEEVRFTAVYPVLERDETGNYGKGQLYGGNGGGLKDILFCQDSCGQGNIITLQFRHRFSQLNFTADKSLNGQIAEAQCRTAGIESFNPRTGEIIYDSQPHSGTYSRNDEGIYSFIIPPSPRANAFPTDFSLLMSDQTTHTTTLADITFREGYAYSCKVKMKDSGTGIYTAEDFIAFSHLVNGEEYEGRALEEFGEELDGTVVYYLKDDIEFTEEESERLMRIGGHQLKDEAFKDIFDGQGHTLSNISLNAKTDGYTNYGIFGEIDTTGVIRNLIVENISYTQNGNVGYVGLLIGVNRGKIYNCVVRNGSVQMTDAKENCAGMANYNYGQMFNCRANGITITYSGATGSKTGSGAGLVRYNTGDLLNCYVAHITFKGTDRGTHLCHENRGNIQNCYVYGAEGKQYAICYNVVKNARTSYCYYPNTYSKAPIGYDEGSFREFLETYDNGDYTMESSGGLLHERLDRWIEETGKTDFPELELAGWEQGADLPAVFVVP